MQTLTSEPESSTTLLDASSSQTSSSLTDPLTSVRNFFPIQNPSIDPFDGQVPNGDHPDDDRPDTDTVDQLDELFPGNLDEDANLMEAEERNRLIRLNGDENSSSPGSSQESVGEARDRDQEDLRRVKVSNRSILFPEPFFHQFSFSAY